ncbi:MAG: permease [Gemmatimonadetes bacterium]|nr:permease [Gemmatimonadota bacterium]
MQFHSRTPVIVVSHEFWRGVLNGDSSAIGRTVGVNGTAFTVIGVAPAGFRGVFTPLVTSAWVPLMMQPRVRPKASLESASMSWLWTFGRLEEGVSREAARQELLALTAARIAERVEPEWMRKNDGIRLVSLTGLPDDAQKTMLAFTGVLLGVAFLVLLIASVNVAAMLSARAVARQHEMAIRVALGAGRTRLVRQLLTESLVVFALGAAGGLSVAFLATRMLERIPLPTSMPLSLHLTPDVRVLTFALAIALACGVLFGLAPALRAAKLDITSRLRNDSRTGDARKGIVSNALVVGQLALSLVLLVSAGLLLRALDRGNRVDPRFDVNGVVTAAFKSEAWGYNEQQSRVFFNALRERVLATPGVTNVSYAAQLPLQMSSSGTFVQFDGEDATPGARTKGTRVETNSVDVDYFSVVKIPLLMGRAFQQSDDAHATRVAVVNETLARKHWPNGSAIGRTFIAQKEQITVVGVVRDAKYGTLTEVTPEMVYYPTAQAWPNEQTLMIRMNGTAESISGAVQDATRSLDPVLPRPEVVTLRTATSFVLLPQRWPRW